MSYATWGSANQFATGQPVDNVLIPVDTNTIVIVYRVSGTGEGLAVAGTVSGTTVTFGTPVQFVADMAPAASFRWHHACKLDTNKFAVVYADDALDDDGYARVGTVSGTTISFGTAVEFKNTDVEYLTCGQITTDKFAIAYNDETNGDHGFCTICTVSGTTITPGASVQFDATMTADGAITAVNSSKILLAYKYWNASAIKVIAATISGTTPTFGAATTFSSTASEASYMQVEAFGEDRFVLAWNIGGAIDDTFVCAGSIAGTTLTKGTNVKLNDNQGSPTSLTKMSPTSFYASYTELDGNSYGTYHYCVLDGLTIIDRGKEYYLSSDTNDSDFKKLTTGTLVAAYTDASNNGQAIVSTAAATAEVTYPVDALTRVTGIRDLFIAGNTPFNNGKAEYYQEVYLGGLANLPINAPNTSREDALAAALAWLGGRTPMQAFSGGPRALIDNPDLTRSILEQRSPNWGLTPSQTTRTNPPSTTRYRGELPDLPDLPSQRLRDLDL